MKLEKKSHARLAITILIAILIVACAMWFVSAILDTEEQVQDRELHNLEVTIRRAVAACYAAEGVYPPDLAYLEGRYGLQINKERYEVFYEAIAENLMPDITVVER